MNVILILVFNYSNCLHHLDFLVDLYAPHFCSVVVYSDFPTSAVSAKRTVHYVSIERGYCTQRVFVDFRERYAIELAECDGIFYLMDDCILNVEQLASVFDPNAILMSQLAFPLRTLAEQCGWNWDRPHGKRAIRIVESLHKPLPQQQQQQQQWCGGFSDYFYIPRAVFCAERLISEWQHFQNVFLEIIIPSALHWIAAETNTSIVYLTDNVNQLVLWGHERNLLNSKAYVVNALRSHIILHPLKFNENPKRKQWLLDAGL